ncbi:hypothetical protein SAMN05192558_105231 [Actinokineospora alba]|uniref:Uncharacterized protein n=1 Tax=Actinokineospora alba TaxID=504798 RepID=A0A1H0N7P9_9PSEU|nr:hypothetical protein [Actinokineospora alba]TDP68602.1 hypothetical protein C8E96_4167 [Actinokineospora alba]SDH82632.1 hypothetical protein SAMN05421871_102281 [Actinokineospora alba]SDO88556.1 hypothetical protein SAMN05192558_105231 [Actinokineospora alba]
MPTDFWPAWISFAAALIQTTAAIIQVNQGRRGSTAIGPGVSTGVRYGLAALVLELGGWLVARSFDSGPSWVAPAAFAPAVVLGVAAFLKCLRELLTTPPAPERPRPVNAPLNPNHLGLAQRVMDDREREYQRELRESRLTGAQALSLMLGAAAGLAVAYTSVFLSGVAH